MTGILFITTSLSQERKLKIADTVTGKTIENPKLRDSNILIIFGEIPRAVELFSVRVTPSRYFFVFNPKSREGKSREVKKEFLQGLSANVVQEGDGR